MFTKLLVPLDNSPLAEQALPVAESLARSMGATIELVYAHEPHSFGGYTDSPWNAARRSSEDSYIQAIALEVQSGASVVTRAGLATGAPAQAICARAQECGADAIVMTTRGRTGLSRAMLGSVAEGVIRESTIPVLLLRAADLSTGRAKRPTFKRVLVALDASTASESILGPAAELARSQHGGLIIVQIVVAVPLVISDPTACYAIAPPIPDVEATTALVSAASHRLTQLAARFKERGAGPVETHVIVHGLIGQAICDAARQYSANIVAMATGPCDRAQALAGNITDVLLHRSELPLLLCRPANAK